MGSNFFGTMLVSWSQSGEITYHIATLPHFHISLAPMLIPK